MTVTTCGEEGLKEVRFDGFDLIVSDYRMPGGLSGVELLERVRARGETAHVPFLMVTTDPAPSLRRRLDEISAASGGRAEILGKGEGLSALREATLRLLRAEGESPLEVG